MLFTHLLMVALGRPATALVFGKAPGRPKETPPVRAPRTISCSSSRRLSFFPTPAVEPMPLLDTVPFRERLVLRPITIKQRVPILSYKLLLFHAQVRS